MNFIKISISDKLEQIINVDCILQIVKGEDYLEGKYIPSYSLLLKNFGPQKITEKVYNQIKEQIGF